MGAGRLPGGTVTPERWQKVKAVLEDVLERAAPERTAFLDLRCAEDDELRREVESLLESETEACDFIETPVFRIRTDDAPPLAEGERIGPYRIVREIGRGGMGAVYLAERADQEFDRRVALKLIRRGMDSDEIVHRFRSERQILAHLDHDNIAKLLDGGTTEDGRPYFVMEHVEGQPLDEYCDARGLSVRARLELFRQVCAAVHFAHQNLVVHRDLKPGNIVVTADGTPKLLDFGIAKLIHPGQEPFALTRADLRPMTPDYASPEQVRGEAISTASDVYSLGVLLYGLLTGRSPYRPKTGDPQGLAQAICEETPTKPSGAVSRLHRARQPNGSSTELTAESLRQTRSADVRVLRRQLAGDLDTIVLKAMSKEPQRRYASVDQMANDIERHLNGLPVIARKDTVAYRTAKFVGRHKLGVSLAAALLALIIGFSVTVTLLLDQAIRERRRAESVAGFLEDLFDVSDPGKSRGENVTAKEMLDRGSKKIDEGLKGQPELRADLKETMGRVYGKLGDYASARDLLADALRWRLESFGDHDPRVAQNLLNLANVVGKQGNDSEAERLVREGLGILRRKRQTQSIDFAKGLTNLAEILEETGRLGEAEALLKESLDIKRRLPNPNPRDIATSLNNLGKLTCARAEYSVCEGYYREALRIRRRLAGGRPDPDLARSLNNVASLLEDRRDLAGAEALYGESLAMRRQLYGDRNANVAPTLNNLGHVLQAQGKAAAAEQKYREAAAMIEEAVGKEDPNRAIFLTNLATVLLKQRKAAEAEATAREALAIFRDKKPDSWRVADTESVLGACLAAQRRFQDAEPLLTGSYPKLRKDQGDGAKHAPEARQRIVDLYTAWGKPDKAAAYRSL